MVLTSSDCKRRDKLVIRRDNIKSALVTLKRAVDKHQADLGSDPDALPLLITRTEKYLDHLGDITCDLIELEPDIDHAEVQEKLEGEFCDLVTIARRIIRQRTIDVASSNSSTRDSPNPFGAAASHTTYTRLPEQSLPTFDGRYETWLSFKEDFEALVGKRSDLADAQKLRYLRSCLKGEPERLLRQHGISDADYNAAWKMLAESFEHKNKIAERHFDGILSIPALQRESPRELSELINTVQLHLSALKSLGQPVDQWSSFLAHIVVNKLDKSTRRDWKKTQKGNVISKYNDLITFLREAVLSADDWSPPSTSSRDDRPNGQHKPKGANPSGHSSKGQKRSQCFATTATVDCHICKEAHPTARCQQFKGLSPRERHDAAVRAALCLNCLRSEHRTNECTSKYTCRVCKKKHHTWLHFPEPAQPPSAPASASHA